MCRAKINFLILYYINRTLLIIIHILFAQKWAGGFTEPPATARLRHHAIRKQKKEPAVADSYIKQCDLRAYFDEKRLDRVFLE